MILTTHSWSSLSSIDSHHHDVMNYIMNNNRKAVRATLILIPLLGLQYVLTPFRPPPGSHGEIVYEVLAAIFTSFQVCYYDVLRLRSSWLRSKTTVYILRQHPHILMWEDCHRCLAKDLIIMTCVKHAIPKSRLSLTTPCWRLFLVALNLFIMCDNSSSTTFTDIYFFFTLFTFFVNLYHGNTHTLVETILNLQTTNSTFIFNCCLDNGNYNNNDKIVTWLQGLCVAMLFCFFNGEVMAAVKKFCTQKIMQRPSPKNCCPTAASALKGSPKTVHSTVL